MRLKGKVAVVTGGTSGIGRRIVERFAEEGALVVFTGRRVGLGEEVAAATGARFVAADVSLESDAERTVRAALDLNGRLDILVNNAGVGSRVARLENTPLDDFDRMFAINLRGPLMHMKRVAPTMRAQKSGSIVNIGSIAAHRGGFGSLSYSTAKAALNHLTRLAALELGEDNVRVNSISVGSIATGIFGKIMGMDPAAAEATVDKVKSVIGALQPIPRAGLPDDVAAVALFLAGDESTFINGEDVVVDGGEMAGRRYSDVRSSAQAYRDLLK
jgi:NAD(P)-dependent dehydrogenase (short-subunit alcohol dehydrogenase family)